MSAMKSEPFKRQAGRASPPEHCCDKTMTSGRQYLSSVRRPPREMRESMKTPRRSSALTVLQLWNLVYLHKPRATRAAHARHPDTIQTGR